MQRKEEKQRKRKKRSKKRKRKRRRKRRKRKKRRKRRKRTKRRKKSEKRKQEDQIISVKPCRKQIEVRVNKVKVPSVNFKGEPPLADNKLVSQTSLYATDAFKWDETSPADVETPQKKLVPRNLDKPSLILSVDVDTLKKAAPREERRYTDHIKLSRGVDHVSPPKI